jgi:hypothetical protein
MMMSFISLGFVGLLWAVVGYSLALSKGNDWIGDLEFAGLNNVGLGVEGAIVTLTIPHLLYMAFQGTFCIITAALISGAIVERMRFSAYVMFICLWMLVVYSPIAHWVWGGGWLSKLGALDFAGGTVVHVNAAVGALVAAICVGPRKDFKKAALMPHNVPFTLLGAGLLWFGWFGFNSGSALAANGIASLAFTTTMFAPAGTLVVWTLLILTWVMVARFAAMRRKDISLKGRVGGRGGAALEGVIEDKVMWKAHNYMHLVEQPTLFYAITLTLAIGDGGGGWSTILAWAYVALRIAHSLVQTTVNVVTYRFILWALAGAALMGLTVQAARMAYAYISYAP